MKSNKTVLTIAAVAILALAIGTVQAAESVDVPNGDFQTIVKPGTTIAATIPDGCYFSIPNFNIKGGGPATYADGTTGNDVELPGWVLAEGSNTNPDCMQGGTWGGPEGSGDIAFLCFGTWGGPSVIESAAPLSVPAGSGMYALSADVMHTARPLVLELVVDGVAQTPNTASSPAGGDFEWVEFTRTYSSVPAGDLKIVVGTRDDAGGGWTGNRASVDNITLTYEVVFQATALIPADEATDVCRTAVLSWVPGIYADTHDVYFGTDETQVTDADRDNPLDVLVSQGQTETYYPTAGTLDLDFGQTYYWRVDEVNAPPDDTIYKGKTWSFTIEPVAYPIANVTATASSEYDPTRGAENTVNGSGLVNDLHSNVMADMWLSGSEAAGARIEYAFDRLYKLHEMWVWNFNDEFNNAYGLKDVTIEYSADGDDWTELAGVPEFAQAAGSPDYADVTTVDFTGVTARYVRITANTNWGGSNLYGLSEVRFFYVPVHAREPYSPPSGTDVPLDVTLSWTAGREAERHDVYLGTNEQAVANGTISPVSIPADDGCVAGYDPLLELGRTYYWKVNEVNMVEEPNTWEGDIWSFSTPEYLVVDDMESYGGGDVVGEPGSKIWYTWKDGAGWTSPEPTYIGNGSGSIVDLGTDPAFGSQSLMYNYSSNGTNSLGMGGKDFYSEATALISDLEIGNDWTVNGIKSLSLPFYGDPGNAAGPTEQMYVKLNGARVAYDGDANDITEPSWHEWLIDLADFGINLENVTEISIGFGNKDNVSPGGLGVVYFDDIRLYPSRCVLSLRSPDFARADYVEDCVVDYKEVEAMAQDWLVTAAVPSDANQEAYYEFEGNLLDSSGNGHHGDPVGTIAYTTGQIGQAIDLDGSSYVNVTGYKGILATSEVQHPFTIANWFKTTGDAEMVTWGTDAGRERLSWRVDGGRLRTEHGSGNLRGDTYVDDGEWHHGALVVNEGANLQVPNTLLYVDGKQDSTFSGSDTTYNLTAGADVSIGRRATSDDRYFNGLIDDVRIYDYGLSRAEILYLADKPAADLNKDKIVDFEDFAELAVWWLDEQLWP